MARLFRVSDKGDTFLLLLNKPRTPSEVVALLPEGKDKIANILEKVRDRTMIKYRRNAWQRSIYKDGNILGWKVFPSDVPINAHTKEYLRKKGYKI